MSPEPADNVNVNLTLTSIQTDSGLPAWQALFTKPVFAKALIRYTGHRP